MSTHNICFHGEVRKISIYIPLLPGTMKEAEQYEKYGRFFTKYGSEP